MVSESVKVVLIWDIGQIDKQCSFKTVINMYSLIAWPNIISVKSLNSP